MSIGYSPLLPLLVIRGCVDRGEDACIVPETLEPFNWFLVQIFQRISAVGGMLVNTPTMEMIASGDKDMGGIGGRQGFLRDVEA